MSPHRDMFVDYQDIRHERQYVRLGDKNKRILIHGRGTMCIEVGGRKIAYTESLHVSQLSAIPLSTRVHRRSASGCLFLADNSGCFLTYPTFHIEINNSDDCTIDCQTVPSGTQYFDFDSRRHVTQHSSSKAVRVCQHLAFRAMQHSRLSAVQKATSHIKNDNAPRADIDRPTIPVHSVPNSGASTIERINAFELKKYFGCRGLSDWATLEHTGSGIHMVQDKDAPTTRSRRK
jgi:hypothetical protein